MTKREMVELLEAFPDDTPVLMVDNSQVYLISRIDCHKEVIYVTDVNPEEGK